MATAFHYCSRHIIEDVWDDAGEGIIGSNWRVAAGPHWWTGCRPKTALLSFVPGRNGHLRGNGEGGGRERGGEAEILVHRSQGQIGPSPVFFSPRHRHRAHGSSIKVPASVLMHVTGRCGCPRAWDDGGAGAGPDA